MLSSVQSSVVQTPSSVLVHQDSCGASPETQLLALIVKNQSVQGQSAEISVGLSQEQLKQLREAVREALEAAREANDKGGFWGALGDVMGGDVATLAEVVVVAAAAAATGGAAALVLGAIAISCSLASKYADELGIPPNVALGLGIVAGLTMAASGNLSATGSVFSFSGASHGAVAVGAEASRLSQAAQQVHFYARLAAPAARGVGTGLNTVGSYFKSDALEHDADARLARSREQLQSMDLDAAVDVLGKTIDRQLAAMTEVTQTLEANQQATQLMVQSFGRMA